MKRVVLLGSTGSIGRTALRVLLELPHSHRVVGVAAHHRVEPLKDLIRAWPLEAVAVVDPLAAAALKQEQGSRLAVISGPDAAARLVEMTRPDIVLNGISGAAGLMASLVSVELGLDLLLANKESMVMAGPLLAASARKHAARILPVDSEHSAIFQCIHREPSHRVRRAILTASGGPFLRSEAGSLESVTPADALQHPTWKMGSKITIDSATLINKALEVVEARWLFDLAPDQIEVVVHPQSIVHSMVEFVDGSILAQMGVPDMAVPIRFALSYPGRSVTADCYFDLQRFGTLTFEVPDRKRFPGLDLGFLAARLGGTAGAILNAANEVAVDRFLQGALRFTEIAEVSRLVLEKIPIVETPSLDQILAADQQARAEANRCRR